MRLSATGSAAHGAGISPSVRGHHDPLWRKPLLLFANAGSHSGNHEPLCGKPLLLFANVGSLSGNHEPLCGKPLLLFANVGSHSGNHEPHWRIPPLLFANAGSHSGNHDPHCRNREPLSRNTEQDGMFLDRDSGIVEQERSNLEPHSKNWNNMRGITILFRGLWMGDWIRKWSSFRNRAIAGLKANLPIAWLKSNRLAQTRKGTTGEYLREAQCTEP